MNASRTSALFLALVALGSLALLLLAFAAGIRSNETAAVVLLICFPLAAALLGFKTSQPPIAIAAAFLLPVVLFAVWSSAVSGSAPTGLIWLAVLLSSFAVLWLAARLGRFRKEMVHRENHRA